jgi:hypothetical protein
VGINEGELSLGRFHCIIFTELDGARKREITVGDRRIVEKSVQHQQLGGPGTGGNYGHDGQGMPN